MTSRTDSRSAEERVAELVRTLSQEVRKGIVEGAIIISLGFSLLGWSLAVREADPARLAALWSSIPVVLLGMGYFVRSYADSQVPLRGQGDSASYRSRGGRSVRTTRQQERDFLVVSNWMGWRRLSAGAVGSRCAPAPAPRQAAGPFPLLCSCSTCAAIVRRSRAFNDRSPGSSTGSNWNSCLSCQGGPATRIE